MAYNSLYPLEGFDFRKVGSGAYEVTFESDFDRKRCRCHRQIIRDMTIIDAVLHCRTPKAKDIQHLRRLVKEGELVYYF